MGLYLQVCLEQWEETKRKFNCRKHDWEMRRAENEKPLVELELKAPISVFALVPFPDVIAVTMNSSRLR